MTALSTFRNGAYEGYQSDEEVLRAIEIVAGMDIPADGSGDSEAERIWSDPTPEEQAAVEAEAWKLADAGTERPTEIKFLTISSNRAGGEISRASFASADQPCTVAGYRAALASVGTGLRFGGVGAELNGHIMDVTPLIGATDADTVTNVIAVMSEQEG